MSTTLQNTTFRYALPILMLVGLCQGIYTQQLNAQHAADKGSNALPKARVEKMVYELGTAIQGEVFDVKLKLFNDGEGDLKIIKVQPSCGCTRAKTDGKPFRGNQKAKTGEFIEFGLQIDTSKLKADSYEKNAKVYTNDPKLRNYTVLLKFSVKTIASGPPVVQLVGLLGEEKTVSFEIGKGSEHGYELEKSETFRKFYEITKVEKISKDGGYRINLKAGKGRMAGTNIDKLFLTLKCSDGATRKQSYEVKVTHLERIQVGPAKRITFKKDASEKLAKTKKPVYQDILLKGARKDIMYSITKLTLTGHQKDIFRTELIVEKEKHAYRIRVYLDEYLKGRRFGRAKLKIETDDPQSKPIQISLFAMFDPKLASR